MKNLLSIIKRNKKRLTYLRQISQSRTYFAKNIFNREKLIKTAKTENSLSVYFINNKGLNCYERNYFRSQNI